MLNPCQSVMIVIVFVYYTIGHSCFMRQYQGLSLWDIHSQREILWCRSFRTAPVNYQLCMAPRSLSTQPQTWMLSSRLLLSLTDVSIPLMWLSLYWTKLAYSNVKSQISPTSSKTCLVFTNVHLDMKVCALCRYHHCGSNRRTERSRWWGSMCFCLYQIY